MVSSSALVSSALFCLVFLSYYSQNTRGEDFATVSVASLLPSSSCTPNAQRGNSLQVINRNGPCSGKQLSKLTQVSSLAHDALRVASIQARVTGSWANYNSTLLGTQISIPARSGLYLGSGNYVITLSLGTPTKTQTVIFDTGSNINWVQCRPCAVACYSQAEPIFDPVQSSTYRNVTCTDPLCTGLSIRGCSTGTCLYSVTYGDGSSTVGFLATDTLTLTPTNVLNNFVFGCGQNNRGLFKGAAGLLGLGRSSYSLNSQLSGTLGKVFSYCLPSTDSLTGYLNLGSPLKPPTGFTAILTNSRAPSLYFIDLIGISVGATRLNLSPTVFRSVGTLIDSGTVITRLPPMAYAALRAEFQARMTQYARAPAVSILDTCYNFASGTTISYPIIKLHYTSLDVTLPGVGVFYPVGGSTFCLAFAGNTDPAQPGIIGNVQQKTFEVTYDIPGNRIGFATAGCG
ncbi:aspartyl protease family protein At5g10770-like isoform X2 [Wolffia australiana]